MSTFSILRKGSVDTTCGLIITLLSVVDVALLLVLSLGQAVASLFKGVTRSSSDLLLSRPSVVVVGGSFSGLWAQRALSDSYDVTLVDFKDYFEYTPGVLRLFVQPSWLSRLSGPLPRRRNKLVVGEVVAVHPTEITLRTADGEEAQIPFDYLLLGCGSSYAAAPVKASPREPDLPSRRRSWEEAAARLARASSVLIAGGGPVAVELAAEVLDAYPSVSVTLVTSGTSLCSGLPAAVGEASARWLELRGAALQYSSRVESVRPDSVTLVGGQVLSADIVYPCMGAPPASAPLEGSLASQLDERRRLRLTPQLQPAEQNGSLASGWSRVFGMGDVASLPAGELQLGHTAELNAHVAAENMRRSAAGRPLEEYPRGAVGCERSPRVFCVSLGPHDGVVAFNGLVLSGAVAAVTKRILEWTKVAACAERPVGVAFWKFGDAASAWLSMTVLPPPPPAPHEPKVILLFDGVCLLCSTFVHFLLDHNADQRIHFCALQSEPGKDILTRHGLPLDVSTVVLIDECGAHVRSSAALRTLRHCGAPYCFLYALAALPRPLRDFGYRMVAASRYRLFGKDDGSACRRMTKAMRARFLST